MVVVILVLVGVVLLPVGLLIAVRRKPGARYYAAERRGGDYRYRRGPWC